MSNQDQWIGRARAVFPAGGFGNFAPDIVIRKGKGALVWDEDGNKYVDYLIGSGPMLLGHGHPEVLDAVQSQLGKGLTFFANNAAGIELAEQICAAVACAQQVRFVTSGGEADMYALRLARAFTGRTRVMKFEGGYHGMSAEAQMSLAPAEPTRFPRAIPDSAGIPASVVDEMVIAPFNDTSTVQALLDELGDSIAAVIVEPLQRVIAPQTGFLQFLREQCTQRGIVLIFDEVVTGFRLAYGGAQEAYGVTPDLCTLGKIIGGGFPLAAIAGRKDLMDHFDQAIVGPDGFLMQVGTLSGNPVAAVAGLKTMEILRRDGAYNRLYQTGEAIQSMIRSSLAARGHAIQITGHPTLFDVIFSGEPIVDYQSMQRGNRQEHARFNRLLRQNGIFKSPGKWYVSLALGPTELAQTSAAIETAAAGLAIDP